LPFFHAPQVLNASKVGEEKAVLEHGNCLLCLRTDEPALRKGVETVGHIVSLYQHLLIITVAHGGEELTDLLSQVFRIETG
jgi:hypothetical protein